MQIAMHSHCVHLFDDVLEGLVDYRLFGRRRLLLEAAASLAGELPLMIGALTPTPYTYGLEATANQDHWLPIVCVKQLLAGGTLNALGLF
jgi:hypothetical protein